MSKEFSKVTSYHAVYLHLINYQTLNWIAYN